MIVVHMLGAVRLMLNAHAGAVGMFAPLRGFAFWNQIRGPLEAVFPHHTVVHSCQYDPGRWLRELVVCSTEQRVLSFGRVCPALQCSCSACTSGFDHRRVPCNLTGLPRLVCPAIDAKHPNLQSLHNLSPTSNFSTNPVSTSFRLTPNLCHAISESVSDLLHPEPRTRASPSRPDDLPARPAAELWAVQEGTRHFPRVLGALRHRTSDSGDDGRFVGRVAERQCMGSSSIQEHLCRVHRGHRESVPTVQRGPTHGTSSAFGVASTCQSLAHEADVSALGAAVGDLAFSQQAWPVGSSLDSTVLPVLSTLGDPRAQQ